MSKKTDKWIIEHQNEMVEDLQSLVKIRSLEAKGCKGKPFGKEVDKALQTALAIGNKLEIPAKNLDGYCGILDAGKGRQTMGILCHLDIVPEGDGWKYPPYAAEIHSGKMFGRGTLDDKGPAVAAMYALKSVIESGYKFNKKVRIILGCNEETGMKCIEYYSEHEKNPSFTITPDGTFPLSNSEKNIMRVSYKKSFKSAVSMNVGDAPNIVPGKAVAVVGGIEYKTKGVQTHASLPETGKNAMQMMFRKLNGLKLAGTDGEVLKFFAQNFGMEYNGQSIGLDITDASGRQTVNFGMIRWNEKGFTVTLDLRCPASVPEKKIIGILDETFAKIGAKRGDYEFSKGYNIPDDAPLVKTLMGVYRKKTGDKTSKPVKMGGGTYARHLPNAVSFGPEGYMCGSECHVANEYIGIDQLIFNAQILADAIIALACEK